MSERIRYEVYRSRSGPAYPTLLAGATREEADRYAREHSAADRDGRTYVIERADTWAIVAEYRRGQLRTDRPHARPRIT
jgi:hypothetical protein